MLMLINKSRTYPRFLLSHIQIPMQCRARRLLHQSLGKLGGTLESNSHAAIGKSVAVLLHSSHQVVLGLVNGTPRHVLEHLVASVSELLTQILSHAHELGKMTLSWDSSPC